MAASEELEEGPAVPDTERVDALADQLSDGLNSLSAEFQLHSERTTMLRGNSGFGRKPKKSLLRTLAQYGPTDIHHYDDHTGETTIETIHDATAIIEANVRAMNSGHDGYSPSRELRLAARIPMGEADRLFKMGINPFNANDWPKLAAILDDPEYRKWRTVCSTISKRPVRQTLAPRHSRVNPRSRARRIKVVLS